MSFLAFENLPLPFFSLLSKLGTRSYGVYLIQVIPMELTAKLVYHILPGLMAYQLIWLTLIVVMAIGVPVIMMEIINHSVFRRYYKYLFG
jgi:peptidoglycan/LPS O-acetylase OafA/YrhL